MAENINGKNFRAALHGFNREDVVAYIDSMTLEQEKERRSLQDANLRLQSQLDEANEALEAAKENPSLRQTLDEATAELAELREELAKASSENVALTAKNHALEAELSQLREQQGNTAARPLSAPIPPVGEVLPIQPSQKDYSELELAAYRRAEVTERLARERAAEVYRQVRAVFGNASARIDTGKSDLDQLTRTLQLDINQLLQLLSTIRSSYAEAEQSFQAVSEKNRQLAEAEF